MQPPLLPSPCHLTVCHKSVRPVVLSQTLQTLWQRAPPGLGPGSPPPPAYHGGSLRRSVTQWQTHQREGRLASPRLASPPAVHMGRKEKGSSWLSASRPFRRREKRVCLSAEARSSLDNSHILLRDCWDKPGRWESPPKLPQKDLHKNKRPSQPRSCS